MRVASGPRLAGSVRAARPGLRRVRARRAIRASFDRARLGVRDPKRRSSIERWPTTADGSTAVVPKPRGGGMSVR